MNGVALRARDIIQRVLRSPNVCSRKTLRMAAQAGVEDLAGSKLRECNNRRLPAMRGDMGLPWTMTSLAACIFRLLFAGSDALEMRVLIEPEPNIRVAGLTNHASHKPVRAAIGGQETKRGPEKNEKKSKDHRPQVTTRAQLSLLSGCQPFVN